MVDPLSSDAEPKITVPISAFQNKELEVQQLRHMQQLELDVKRHRLEAIKLARDILTENSRSKPVDSREITAEDITSFANTIVNYVNS